jgi:hypothetical protein
MMAGTSKLSIDCTKTSTTDAMIAGRRSGAVTRRSVARREAPDIRAASSSDGSIARNAATISRNAIGDRCSPCTQIIPGIENTLSTSVPNALLMTPVCGSARKIQAMAYSIAGMIRGTSDAAKKSALSGASVRTWTQARAAPRTSAKTADPRANSMELTSIGPARLLLPNASPKPFTVKPCSSKNVLHSR